MNWNIHNLVRDNIRSLVPYSSARDDFSGSGSVFLDANESPFNSPLNRYPDPHQEALKIKLSGLKQVPVENIFLGNGSDEAIDLLFRIFCEPGRDNAVVMEPSYGMYSVCANINNVTAKKVMLDPDFSLDPDRIIAATDTNTRLIFLCSPNNPTSNLLDRESVLKIIETTGAVVVIDEAYIDFSGSVGFLNDIFRFGNLVVLQTLSKAWALAGIRLGMAFASAEIIHYMSMVKYPYNVNILTINMAIEELDKGDRRLEWINSIINERERIGEMLKQMTFVEKVYRSDANFLLVRVNDPSGLYRNLLENGVIVRDRSSVPLCEGCLRITIGDREENNVLLEMLNHKST